MRSRSKTFLATYLFIILLTNSSQAGPTVATQDKGKEIFDDNNALRDYQIQRLNDIRSSEYVSFGYSTTHYVIGESRPRTRLHAVTHMASGAVRTHLYNGDDLLWAGCALPGRVIEYAPKLELPGGVALESVLLQYDGPDHAEIEYPALIDASDGCAVGTSVSPWNNTLLPERGAAASFVRQIAQCDLAIQAGYGSQPLFVFLRKAGMRDDNGMYSFRVIHEYSFDAESGDPVEWITTQESHDQQPHVRVRRFRHFSSGGMPDRILWEFQASDFTEENTKTDPMFALDREYLASLKESPTPLDDPAGIITQLIQKLGITEEVVRVDQAKHPETPHSDEAEHPEPVPPGG